MVTDSDLVYCGRSLQIIQDQAFDEMLFFTGLTYYYSDELFLSKKLNSFPVVLTTRGKLHYGDALHGWLVSGHLACCASSCQCQSLVSLGKWETGPLSSHTSPFVRWYSLSFKIKVTFGHKMQYEIKSYVSWNLSQTSSNELECCHKQCKCCCWWTTKLNNSLHLFNNWYLNLTATTHINAVLCVSVPSAQNGGLLVKLVLKNFNSTMDTPSSLEGS